MHIVFAGSCGNGINEYVRELDSWKMFSILNELSAIKKQIRETGGVKLMVDSGAHSWNKKELFALGGASQDSLPKL